MPDVAEQPGKPKPPRTWRPMVGWTLGILAALGLAWFVGAVVVPVWQVRKALPAAYELDLRGPMSSTEKGPLAEERNRLMRVWGFEKDAINRLGGCERAVGRLRFYMKAPGWLAPDKLHAFRFLIWCEEPARPAILEAMRSPDPAIRLAAVAGIMANGCARPARSTEPPAVHLFPDGDDETRVQAIANIERLLSDGDKDVRQAAAEALKRIRGAGGEGPSAGGEHGAAGPDARLRAVVSAIVDDIAALKPKYTQLAGFDAAELKTQPRWGFDYRYKITGSKGKAFEFAPDGCWLYVRFGKPDDGIQWEEREFFLSSEVKGCWQCCGPDVSGLSAAVKEILEKHAEALKKIRGEEPPK